MIISYSHRFIFIHVGKAAGTSIQKAVEPYAHRPERYLMNRLLATIGVHVNYCTHYQKKRFRKHVIAREVRRQLPNRVYDEFFRFAFVRNPWDRMVSMHHYMRDKRLYHRHKLVESLGSFEEYVRWEIKRNKDSQKAFITDVGGNVIVDFVGRFERLRDDFAHLCKELGISATLPHCNKTRHRDYRTYYDSRTIELVADHWREDIELLGYTFDGPVTEWPLETRTGTPSVGPRRKIAA